MNPTFLYVALLWFGAVLVWRRLGGSFPWRVAALFYLLVLMFLFEPLARPKVGLPMDYLFRLTPWSEVSPGVRPHNAELNDLPLQIVPWAHQVREAWTSLKVPLWNPAAAAGYPLLANGQSAAFSLLRWAALPLPLDYSFACEAALKLLLALAGGYLFLRRRVAFEPAAIIGSIGFAFSTAVVVWLHFPLATVSAWIPAVFYGVDLLAERLSYGRFLLMTLVFSQLLLGGHPETAAHAVLGAGIFLLFRVLVASRGAGARERLAPVLRICGAGVVALLISLPQVLPLLEALPSTKRWDMLEAFPDLHERPTRATFLVNFIQPAFFGTVRDATAWGPAHAEVISGYGGIFLGIAWVGMLLWTIRERRWRDERFLFALLVPLFIGIALNWPVVSEAFESLPLFSLAANARVRLLVVWFGAVLAASLLDLLRSGVRWPVWGGSAAMAAALGAAFALNPIDRGSDPMVWAVATSLPGMAVIAGSAILAALPPRLLRSGSAALLILVVADLWTQVHQWNPVVPRSWFYPRTPMISRMVEIARNPPEDDPKAWRMTGTNGMLFPNTAAMYGLEDIRGHDPMANGRVLGVLRVFTGYTSDNYFGMLRDVSHPLIDYLNVRYVLTSAEEELDGDSWERIYSGRDGKIFRNLETMPRFFAVERVLSEFDDERRTRLLLEHTDWSGTAIVKRLPSRIMPLAARDLFGEPAPGSSAPSVRLVRAEGDQFEMEIEATRWTLVVSSQPDWPGWRVIRNGDEALKTIKVNVAFMGFLVPPGSSTIRVYYAPRSFWVGSWIALSTLAGLALAGVAVRWRRKAAALPPL
ncbi:MAG TPA: hypothetical protein VMS56_05710 [Thermoanaerobaculia bacterium]|nr:hypothetical protein [Thermoanaerobaculia bacterium]